MRGTSVIGSCGASSEAAIDFGVKRAGLASLLFAVARARESRAAVVNGDRVRLAFGSRWSEVAVRDISAIRVNQGKRWGQVTLVHERGESTVSGLEIDEAAALAQVVGEARLHWWRLTLAGEIGALGEVRDQVRGLADPERYVRANAIRRLVGDGKAACMAFVDAWPDDLWSGPEVGMFNEVLAFLESWREARSKANKAFVEKELVRSSELFDRIEARPLTAEQRRAVVVDEGRNLVVASAGSGKTSVIVAKTAWLIDREFCKPSELLLLAFARGARNEMEERIRSRVGESARSVSVRTFHGLGLEIIREVEGKRPALTRSAQDERAFVSLLTGIVAELLEDDDVSNRLIDWFQGQFAPYRSEHEFQSWGEYWNYIRGNHIESLSGEKVKSYEECEIANFLFLHGVNYEYEEPYEHDIRTPARRRYKPCFFLPDHKIYIEHFRLDVRGRTAKFVDEDKYLEEVEWKREVHAEHGTVLVETFTGERMKGRLIRTLAARLKAEGVPLSRVSGMSLLDALEEQGRIGPFVRLVGTLLQHFKGSRLSLREVEERARALEDEGRGESFLRVFGKIFESYEAALKREGKIDFYDMIARATDHVEEGSYGSSFGYILVDEFQDISPGRARLLKALLDSRPGAQLFAVGDDWQAIYRFSGSDIAVMREFGRRFGAFERLNLETTFRCVDHICEVGTDFVLRNAAQIKKTVKATRRADGPAVHVGLPGNDGKELLEEVLDRIAEDAQRYEGGSDVLLLGRYRRWQPGTLEDMEKAYPGLSFRYMTVHGAKGLEADYVVVLRLCGGRFGFPSEMADDPLLDLVMAAPEAHPNAEERRLFYVALTRARRQVFLLAEGGPVSVFARELIEEGYGVRAFGRPPEADVPCFKCKEGRLQRRENKSTERVFYGCSNWPYCEQTARPCSKCGSGLPVPAGEGFCCSECGEWMTACPECGSWLEQRSGKHGPFEGCSNFPVCNYRRSLT